MTGAVCPTYTARRSGFDREVAQEPERTLAEEIALEEARLLRQQKALALARPAMAVHYQRDIRLTVARIAALKGKLA